MYCAFMSRLLWYSFSLTHCLITYGDRLFHVHELKGESVGSLYDLSPFAKNKGASGDKGCSNTGESCDFRPFLRDDGNGEGHAFVSLVISTSQHAFLMY